MDQADIVTAQAIADVANIAIVLATADSPGQAPNLLLLDVARDVIAGARPTETLDAPGASRTASEEGRWPRNVHAVDEIAGAANDRDVLSAAPQDTSVCVLGSSCPSTGTSGHASPRSRPTRPRCGDSAST
jgi:hypothetical protein